MSSSWLSPSRCPNWETRMVRPEHSGHARTIPRQVRCSKRRGHRGPCAWRGKHFGRFTAEGLSHQAQPHACGAPRLDGQPCRKRVLLTRRCASHR